jgi:hypothetical protein
MDASGKEWREKVILKLRQKRREFEICFETLAS